MTLTDWFILIVSIAIAAFDIGIYVVEGQGATISQTVRNWATRFTALPALIAFGMGCLFGHLFLR
jgi:hypothetical protein